MNSLPENAARVLLELTPAEEELIFNATRDATFKNAVIEYLAQGNRVEFCDNGYEWDTARGWWFLWTGDERLAEFFKSRNLRVFFKG